MGPKDLHLDMPPVSLSTQSSSTYSPPMSPRALRFGQPDMRLRTTSASGSAKPSKSAKVSSTLIPKTTTNENDWVIESDPFASSRVSPLSSTSNLHHAPVANPPPRPKKARTSLLMTASDALGFNLSRRRKSIAKAISPPAMEDVLEISAKQYHNDEEAERLRLRDAAAQAVGLNLVDQGHERPEPQEENEDFRNQSAGHAYFSSSTEMRSAAREILANTDRPVSIRSARSSVASGALGRERSLSQSIRSRQITVPSPSPSVAASIPAFPATPATLKPLIQTSSILLKFCPSNSPLLILNRSRQWKIRNLVMTSLTAAQEPGSDSPGDRRSYLHLFKTGGEHEKELERLEINENSVIYVVEEDVGQGRKFVVKVGGIDVGIKKNQSPVTPDETMTIWLLQLSDSAQMQRWIQFIKSAVLMQRAERAGLGRFYSNNYTTNGLELRGDMDVILSLGKQGLLSPPSSPAVHIPSSYDMFPLSPTSTITHQHHASEEASSSNPSTRSRSATVPSPTPPSAAVHALKGLFNASRPMSRQASASSSSTLSRPISPITPSNVDQDARQTPPPEDPSLGNRATVLFNMFRTTTPISSPQNVPQPPSALPPSKSPFPKPTTMSPSQDPHPTSGALGLSRAVPRPHHTSTFSVDWDSIDGLPSSTEKHRSLGSLALAPPPRTRKAMTASSIHGVRPEFPAMTSRPTHFIPSTESTPFRTNNDLDTMQHLPFSNLSNLTLPASPLLTPPSPLTLLNSTSFGTLSPLADGATVARSRSRSSLSSYASDRDRDRDRNVDLDHVRRRSRSGPIPPRLSPPAGPPPSAPTSSNHPHRPPSPILEIPAQDMSESSLSRSSSQHGSPISSPAVAPSTLSTMAYSKRMSSSSGLSLRSNTSGSTTQSRTNSFMVGRVPASGSTGSSNGNSSRSSGHPPQRPSPNFAPPLTPEFGRSGPSPPPVWSEPNQRSARLSLPPGPPPLVALPPRPDEIGYWSSTTPTAALYSIPGSPGQPLNISLPSLPLPASPPPAPPPQGPLPPLPALTSMPEVDTPPAPPASTSRLPSIRHRLKMMTSPSTNNPTRVSESSSNATSSINSYHRQLQDYYLGSTSGYPSAGYTPPASPLGEPITTFEDYLSSAPKPPTPVRLSRPIGLPLERISLSPPPRRNSRASRDLTGLDKDKPEQSVARAVATDAAARSAASTPDLASRRPQVVGRSSIADSLIDPMMLARGSVEDSLIDPVTLADEEIGVAVSPRDSMVQLAVPF